MTAAILCWTPMLAEVSSEFGAICLSVCLSVCMYVCMYVCPFTTQNCRIRLSVFCYCTLDISWTVSYEITLICLCRSICPSVLPSISLSIHLSPNFLKRRSLIFCVIAHDDCWPWYLVTNKANFFLKKLAAQISVIWAQNLCLMFFNNFFIFYQMIALQKLWKMFFILSKNLFPFSRYSNFCIFIFPSFSLSVLTLELDSR